MESSQGQLALIKVWAIGSKFEVDTTKSPKANFAGLAKAQGWNGGDANWQLHWETCFKEIYPFGHHGSATPVKPVAALRSRCRLSMSSENSVGSADSDFSIISAAPSIQSLDTNGSVFGGIVLGVESVKLESTENTAAPDSNNETQRSKVSATLTLSAENMTPAVQSGLSNDVQSFPKGSPFWYQYPGFEPNLQAPFNHELSRLYKHLGAKTKKDKKDLKAKALTAEIEVHYGTHMSRLDRWQELCEEIGIEKIPTSITQCQKALKPVFVNLFDLVDHRRNPDLKVQRFQTYDDFNKFTRKGHKFPRNCAKQEGFMKVLLKKI